MLLSVMADTDIIFYAVEHCDETLLNKDRFKQRCA